MSVADGSAAGGSDWYIGLMSGTSLDGVDAVLADGSFPVPRLIGHVHHEFDPALRAELLALAAGAPEEADRCARAGLELAHAYAACVHELLKSAGAAARDVHAIGAHGQTIRHRPHLGYSVQINAPALLAELTGIDVVADFRSRDLAAGGHGAPLVPAFHQKAFASKVPRAVINIGGIANVTGLEAGAAVTGFDCGPGNVLLDAWMEQHFAARFDRDGALAAVFAPDRALVEQWLDDPYFALPPPKSTGRELFTLDWVLRASRVAELPPEVVLSSLTALTAAAVGQAIERWCPHAREIVVCGGGARNATLLQRLADAIGDRRVLVSDALGVAAEHVEALAFAWLAQCHVRREPANLPSVTGARGPRVLGALYPA